MKYRFLKNYKKVRQFARWELEYLVLKSISSDLRVSYYYRFFFFCALFDKGWEYSKVKISNRCFVTYRAGGYLKMSNTSRIVFRKLASFGLLPGIKRASW